MRGCGIGLLALAIGAASGLSMPLSAAAQDYPSKSIRIIVPNPPGGSGDVAARLIAQKLGESFHQSVVVENQAGASGTLGMNTVKRSPPDGYTIGVVISTAQLIDRMQNKAATLDLVRDFTPLTAIGNNPIGLVVHPSVTVGTMAALIEEARKRPGELSFASAGIGTAHHLYGELLNRAAGIKMVNVPYKGIAPALNDVLGGHVPIGIISLSGALPHIRSGRLKALAMFDVKRTPKLPDVPIVTELVPSLDLPRSWIGFLAPADLPPAITARLNGELVRILRLPDVDKVLSDNTLEVIANTPAEFTAMIRRDTKLWEEAASAAGLFAP